MMAGSISSSAVFVDYSGVRKLECGNNAIGRNYYCVPRVFKPSSSFLYHNNGDGTFTDVTKGTAIASALGKGLGVVATDINNDGRMDLFVANDTVRAVDVIVGVNGGPPVLLKNNAAKGNNWLGIKPEGVTCNRDAIGARIIWKAGGKLRERLKNNGGSYLSSHDPREVLGIGTATQIDELEIHWPAPSKQAEKLTHLAPNRYIHIVEGKGVV
jgi:enediyne biosynthesis protein E4